MNYDSTMTTYRAYPNNYNDLFKNTITNMATVAISGANQFGNMRLAYTNKDYKGFLDNFYQKSNTLSFNGRINASDLASFEVVGNLFNVKTNNRYPNISRLTSNGINRDIDFKYFDNFYKDELGQKRILDTYGFPYVFGGAGDGYFNMLWNQLENTHMDNKLHFVGSAKVDLKFTKTISLTGTAGVDYTDWDFTTILS
jgi:iron complex outermembrane receptor protein